MEQTPYHRDIDETEYVIKLKREEIEDFIKKFHGSFDKDILKTFVKCINTKITIKKTGEELYPNVCIIKRSETMNLTGLYTNDFKYVISKHKRWDKDIILIIN